MLLPSAFYPHAECIAKHLPHLRPSQIRGLALSAARATSSVARSTSRAWRTPCGSRDQVLGKGAPGGQQLGVGTCNNVGHGDCKDVDTPQDARRPSFLELSEVRNQLTTWMFRAELTAIDGEFVPCHSLADDTRNRPRTTPIHPRPAILRLPCGRTTGKEQMYRIDEW